VLKQATKISYDRKHIRCKIVASFTSQKAVMQALGIIDCHTEPYLFPVLVVVNFLWWNVPAMLEWKPVLVMSKLARHVDRKTRMTMRICILERCASMYILSSMFLNQPVSDSLYPCFIFDCDSYFIELFNIHEPKRVLHNFMCFYFCTNCTKLY